MKKLKYLSFLFLACAAYAAAPMPTDDQIAATPPVAFPDDGAIKSKIDLLKGRIAQDIGTGPALPDLREISPAEKNQIHDHHLETQKNDGGRISRIAKTPNKIDVDALPKPVSEANIDLMSMAKQFEEMNKLQAKDAKENTDFVAFVSFSMPDDVLKRVITEVSDLGGVVIVRGTIDNQVNIKATVTKIYSLGLSNHSIQINPEAFKRFNITVTPSYVIADAEKAKANANDGCAPEMSYSVISGDISAAYALTEIKEKSSSDISRIADKYLKKRGETK